MYHAIGPNVRKVATRHGSGFRHQDDVFVHISRHMDLLPLTRRLHLAARVVLVLGQEAHAHRVARHSKETAKKKKK